MSDYDGFADQYDQTFELAPFRTHIEAYSLLKLVGDVRDQAWLDLACGTGPYARALRRRGADPVLGVDLSSDMLRVARAAEQQEPLGIAYAQHDVGSMPKLRESRRPNYYLKYGTEISLDPGRPLSSGPTTSTNRSASSSPAPSEPTITTAPDRSRVIALWTAQRALLGSIARHALLLCVRLLCRVAGSPDDERTTSRSDEKTDGGHSWPGRTFDDRADHVGDACRGNPEEA